MNLMKLNSSELPPHLEYAFLEGDKKRCPSLLLKSWNVRKQSAYIGAKVPQRDLAWKLSDILVSNPEFLYPTRFLMEEDYSHQRSQHQSKSKSKNHDVIKMEVEKLLEAEIYFPYHRQSLGLADTLCTEGRLNVVVNEE
ncbi:hypothetical protein Tco_1069925 [Tanacetum coccineum]|uniref:Uncharacterized protein n=1 Tax=Tanacetum coccineum TaxID=301880 RepID=A0ABQ5HM31_9ASTR